jgi:hypothetical protein
MRFVTMNPTNLARIHHALGITRLKAKSKTKASRRAELIVAMRHFLCGWLLEQAKPDELLEITDKYRKSVLN